MIVAISQPVLFPTCVYICPGEALSVSRRLHGCVLLVTISGLPSHGETLERIGVQCPTATPHTDTRWWPVYAFPQDTLAQTVISCSEQEVSAVLLMVAGSFLR